MAESKITSGGTPPQPASNTIAGGGRAEIGRTGSAGTPRKPSRSASGGSTFQLVYGKRSMKAYPITREELTTLAGTGAGATFFFSLSAWIWQFFADVSKDISLAPEAPADQISYWSGLKDAALFGGIVSVVAAMFFVIFGVIKVRQILGTTSFDEG